MRDIVIALAMIEGIGPKKVLSLIGEAAENADLERLCHLVPALREKIVSDDFLEEISYIKNEGIEALSYWDSSYPSSLKEIHVPPAMLFCRGRIMSTDADAVAIVGSRMCSAYGIKMAEKLGGDLAASGVTVISGLARGVDQAAHRGALRAGGRTIAVMGSGHQCLYPRRSERLAQEIIENGVLISEYTSKIQPLRHNFPRRNRIISGLSLGVVVVEASRNSGSLITANYALEQSRDVFAVPGRADLATSVGTNKLISDGAKLVTSVDDILEEIEQRRTSVAKKESNMNAEVKSDDYSEFETCVVETLNVISSAHIDELREATNIANRDLLKTLMSLEIKKKVKVLPGGMYSGVKR